jgi:triosephosphate isomerase (TIM)
MRTPIIAGNWKMNTTVGEAIALVREMRNGLQQVKGVESVVCPPFVSLYAVAELLKATSIGLGAQNLFWEEAGAFTGEIAPGMIAGLCQYVIIGHSERREYFGETDEGVNKKIKAALGHKLTPIVCVGENLAQNEAGETEAFVGGQVRAAFAGLSADQAEQTIIAYEPIWAIGTGKAATPAGAGALIGLTIRGALAGLYGERTAQAIRVQYGGSAKASNLADFMAHPDIDGALVGGASLKAAEFVEMARIAARVKLSQ